MSTDEDLQTQNSTGGLAVLCTNRLCWVPGTEATDRRASVLQLDAEKPDHPASSLRISSASRRHGGSCGSRGRRDTTATCSECTGRTFSVPCSAHGSCGHRTTDDRRRLDDATVAHHSAAEVNPVLPDRVPDNHEGHTNSLMSLHPRPCDHRSHHCL